MSKQFLLTNANLYCLPQVLLLSNPSRLRMLPTKCLLKKMFPILMTRGALLKTRYRHPLFGQLRCPSGLHFPQLHLSPFPGILFIFCLCRALSDLFLLCSWSEFSPLLLELNIRGFPVAGLVKMCGMYIEILSFLIVFISPVLL